MKRIRLIAAVALAAAGLALGPAAAALAAPASAARVAAPAVPAPHPAGCGTAHFCSYHNGNGGSICYNTASSITSWSTSCRTVDSVFNNGAAAGARMYFEIHYGGSWYCLGNGDYLLNMTANTFNKGTGLAGYTQPLANHVKSSKLGSACS
jgi:hypothetical protein